VHKAEAEGLGVIRSRREPEDSCRSRPWQRRGEPFGQQAETSDRYQEQSHAKMHIRRD